jgi:hypothetical protein
MAVFTSGTAPKLLWPGLKTLYGENYAEKRQIAPMVFDVGTSDKSYEEVLELTGLGLAAVKSEGAPVSYDVDGQGYTTRFTNVTYALGVVITQEAIDDNQYQNVAERKVAKLGRSMRASKETVTANILNRAFSNSYPGGDGVKLCSTAHPTVNGTQSNTPSTDVDFSEAALEDAITAIRNFTDSRGIKIDAMPTKIIVPTALAFDVQRVLGSTLQAGTANNDPNAIRQMGLLSTGDIIVWNYLTDTDAWFVKTDVPDSLMMFNRKASSITRDNDFDTTNQKIKAMERYSVGWADWRGIWGTQGA